MSRYKGRNGKIKGAYTKQCLMCGETNNPHKCNWFKKFLFRPVMNSTMLFFALCMVLLPFSKWFILGGVVAGVWEGVIGRWK